MADIVRWNPLRELAAMQSAMDRLFEDTWRSNDPTMTGNTLPLDVYETDKDYTVHTALPGVNPDQINVSFHDGVLTISGEVEETKSKEDKDKRVLLSERSYGKYSRSIRLPQAVDADKIEASYENGVLTLNVPKTPEAQPHLIPVKTNGKKVSSK